MASMLSLLDVLPRHERVDIGGGDVVDVFGVSAEDVAKILERYPNAFAQIADAKGNVAAMDPGLLGAVLAASMRNEAWDSLIGDPAAEKIARSHGIGVQMKLVQAVGRCTFPDGIGPFLEGLASISLGAKEALRVVVQVVSKAQGTKLPPTQRPLAAQDTHPSGS
jgi:hypothetical protein